MKKISLSLIAIAFAINFSYAQWTGAPGDIYYSTGNVGIGTTSPVSKLAVFDLSNSYSGTFGSNGGTTLLALGAGATPRIQGFTAGFSTVTNLLLQPSGGNVGIGTISPNGKLDVNGAVLLSGSSSNTMSRPLIGTTRIAGEISGYSGTGLAADDGFLRLSAGGGTTSSIKSFIDISGYSTVSDMSENITLGTSGTERVRVTSEGNVGIGTANPDQKLTVKGTIHSQEVIVDMSVLPDYVFKPTYHLPTLNEIKAYIDQNHHLPEMPSAEQVAKDGLGLGDMNARLLKKVEELTLYLIEKDKIITAQQKQLTGQQEQINLINQQLELITKKSK